MMTKVGAKMTKDYSLTEDCEDPRFFNGAVAIHVGGKRVGVMGVLHPEVLGNFELKYPVSAIELDFDILFDHFKNQK